MMLQMAMDSSEWDLAALGRDQTDQYELANAGRNAEAVAACERFVELYGRTADEDIGRMVTGTLALLCSCLVEPANRDRLFAAVADLEARCAGSGDWWTLSRLSRGWQVQVWWLLKWTDDVDGAIAITRRQVGLFVSQSDPEAQAAVGADVLRVGTDLCWLRLREEPPIVLGVLGVALGPAVLAGELLRTRGAAAERHARHAGQRVAQKAMLAVARRRRERLTEGLRVFDSVIEHAGERSDTRSLGLVAGAMIHRTVALLALGRVTDFRAANDRAFALDPDVLAAILAEPTNNLGRSTKTALARILLTTGSAEQRRAARAVIRR